MDVKIKKAVEKYRDLIIDAQNFIWANPETGYKEYKTSQYMEAEFKKLGYDVVCPENITGFYTVIDTGRPGPKVLILGELDSLICFDHPEANPETGAVHCCGHSAQCAALLGIAAALKEPGIIDELSGKIMLCAVPAEELIEIEYRSSLREQGIIHYMVGKSEFLYRGYFDDVDMAFMVHTTSTDGFATNKGSVGCVAKRAVYKGVSAHAGGAPWEGCNALYAATLGISAINSVRETFKENDIIRVHPIITKGGSAVNAIPDNVIIESYVRGSNFDAIKEANKKVNRALAGAAYSLGANVDIQDIPGYGVLVNSGDMIKVAEDAAKYFPEVPFYNNDDFGSGSTDMGDLSCVMPVIHPYVPGAKGKSHGADYVIDNPDLACIISAQWQLMMLHLLLSDGAKRAKQIVSDFKPQFPSIKEYLDYLNEFFRQGDCITYCDDGSAIIK